MSNRQPRGTIVRYNAGQRANHWLVAIAFVLLTFSGLALFHPAFYWFSHLFGGGPWNRILHPFIGVFFVIVFAILAIRMWGDNRMRSTDWKWLRNSGKVMRKQLDDVPESGRYNGGQKLLFCAQVLLTLGMLITGIIMWRDFFWGFFSVEVIRIASVLHALFALLFILAIIIHIYAGIWVKGSMRSMTRGTVTPGWAYKHHRAWYRKLIGSEPSSK